MSDCDDLEGVTPQISNDDIERLLSGTPGIESPRLADLTSILHALREPADPVELEGLNSALAAFKAAVVTQSHPSTARKRTMRRKLLTGKALVAVGAITFASAGAAAASGLVATPFSAPRPSLTTAAENVDDDSTEDTAAPGTFDTTTSTNESQSTEPIEPVEPSEPDADPAVEVEEEATDARGPDVNGPAKFGLCTAFEARTKHEETTTTEAGATPTAEPVAIDDLPVPFQALTDAAEAAGQSVADFCSDAVPGGSDSPGKSADNPSATAPGKSADNPSATAPGKSAETPGHSGGNHGHAKNANP